MPEAAREMMAGRTLTDDLKEQIKLRKPTMSSDCRPDAANDSWCLQR